MHHAGPCRRVVSRRNGPDTLTPTSLHHAPCTSPSSLTHDCKTLTWYSHKKSADKSKGAIRRHLHALRRASPPAHCHSLLTLTAAPPGIYGRSPPSRRCPTHPTVLLSECNLLEGQQTDVFRKQQRTDFNDVSFSLVYPVGQRKTRSLDVVCKDRKEYDSWVGGLRYLINHTPPESALKERQAKLLEASTSEAASLSKRKDLSADLQKTLKESSDVYSWGDGSWGQLGVDDVATRTVPELVRAFLGKAVMQISCGYEHTAALGADGELFTWGNGGNGRLGHGAATSLPTPTLVRRTLSDDQEPYIFSKVSCGGMHTLAVTSDGKPYAWGCGASGQLGHGDMVDQLTPREVDIAAGHKIVTVRAGFECSAFVDLSGALLTFGAGDCGVLGHGDERALARPSYVEALSHETITDVQCGDMHMAAVTDNGHLFTWGMGACGQLGLGDFRSRSKPMHVATRGRVLAVACGAAHTVALVAEDAASGNSGSSGTGAGSAAGSDGGGDADGAGGDAAGVGAGSVGGGGGGEAGNSAGGTDGAGADDADGGNGTSSKAQSAAGSSGGSGTGTRLYAWGSSSHGQLGTKQVKLGGTVSGSNLSLGARAPSSSELAGSAGAGSDGAKSGAADEAASSKMSREEMCVTVPKVVEILLGLPLAQVACGAHHTAVVTSNGVLYMFGDARCGQLGVPMTHGTRGLDGTSSSAAEVALALTETAGGGRAHRGSGGGDTVSTSSVSASSDTRSRRMSRSLSQRFGSLSLGGGGSAEAKHGDDDGDGDDDGADEAGRRRRAGSSAISTNTAMMSMSTASVGPQVVASLDNKEIRVVACGGKHTCVMVATQWIKDEETKTCMRCAVHFTTFIRRHHCRNCGGVFCGKCSARRLPLLKLGFIEPVRVCETCYSRLVSGA